MKKFEKKDFKVGMLVNVPAMGLCMILKDEENGLIYVSEKGYMRISDLNDDLLNEGFYNDYSINQVYDIATNYGQGILNTHRRKLLWDRYKKTIQLTKFEYDLIDTNDKSHDRAFKSFQTYSNMMKRGHFKNIKDTSMTLKEILDNCEVIGE